MYSAVEIIGGGYDPSRVSATWTDPDNDSVYHNVFAISEVRNMCDISGYGVSKGDIFQFQMDPNPQNIVCNDCQVASPPPSLPPVSNAIMNVVKISPLPPTGVFTGKLLIAGLCDNYVIQLPASEVVGKFDSTQLASTWQNPSNDSVYTNVFTVSGYCSFGAYNLSQGDSISFSFDPAPPAQTCARCMIYVPTPTAADAVINVKKITSP